MLRSYGKAIVLRFLPSNRVAELSPEEQAIYRQLDPARLPQHVAIIMDGNGRWAGKRSLRRFLGHQQGAESVQFVVETASRINLPWLTLYAFSLENNLRRPKTEVNFLMRLLRSYLVDNVERMNDNNVRIAYIGRTRDIVSVGLGNTTLDDTLAEAAAGQGRVVGPDPEPEKGTFYRSDHFEFAKLGVPALNAKGGMTYLDKPTDYGKAKRDEYVQKNYHKVTDDVKPDWDLSGALEDARLLFEVGYRVAQGDRYPEWKPGTEFREARESMLRAPGK